MPSKPGVATRPGCGCCGRGSSPHGSAATPPHRRGGFRLLSSAETAALDDAIETDPGAHPEWKHEGLADDYAQVMTDDHGGYLVAMYRGVVVRRSGAVDVVVAPSLAGWFWDRVAAFGGRDPRPRRRPDGAPREV